LKEKDLVVEEVAVEEVVVIKGQDHLEGHQVIIE
jgi:hypothetical protein